MTTATNPPGVPPEVARNVLHCVPVRVVRFSTNLYVAAREFGSGCDLTKVHVRAEVDRATGAVTELVAEAWDSDYTEYLTDAQVRELEDEARALAEEIHGPLPT